MCTASVLRKLKASMLCGTSSALRPTVKGAPCCPKPDAPEKQSCWICLGDDSDSDEPLASHCSCTSRFAHSRCLARWQMQCEGTREENSCRFCHARLPDWRATLGEPVRKAEPLPEPRTIRLVYQGNNYLLRVTPTEEGRAVFRRQLMGITGLTNEGLSALNVQFDLHQVPNVSGGASGPKSVSSVDAALDLATAADVQGNTVRDSVRSTLSSLVSRVRSCEKK